MFCRTAEFVMPLEGLLKYWIILQLVYFKIFYVALVKSFIMEKNKGGIKVRRVIN